MTIDKDKLIRLVDKMPTFPASAHRIIELTSDVNCAPRDLVGVIEHDPFLTLKTLKLVNSSYFGLAKEVTSVKHAVVYLGINTIKNVALSVATIGALPRNNELGFDMSDFWRHSLLTGSLGRVLAKRKNAAEGVLSSCYVSGLLHDVGKVVFVQFLPQEYKESMRLAEDSGVPGYEAEQEIIGMHHAEVGGLVAERWQLPGELTSCIREHHDMAGKSKPVLLDCALFAGNQLSKMAQAAQGEEWPAIEQPPQSILEWLGGPLEQVLESLSELPDEIEKARMFVELSA